MSQPGDTRALDSRANEYEAYIFGKWRFIPETNILVDESGALTTLTPLAGRVLSILLNHSTYGVTVAKLEEAWRDQDQVDTRAVLKAVSRLRKEIGADILPHKSGTYKICTPVHRERVKDNHGGSKNSSEAGGVNDDARVYFEQGVHLLRRREVPALIAAEERFERAIERDPSFAHAYALKALAIGILSHAGFHEYSPMERLGEAERLAQQAVTLDPALASARTTCAFFALGFRHDWQAAVKHLRDALERDANAEMGYQGLAHLFLALGRFDEAIRAIDHAKRLSPDTTMLNAAQCWIRTLAGRPEEAIPFGEDAVKTYRDYLPAFAMLGFAYETAGLLDDAVRLYRQGVKQADVDRERMRGARYVPMAWLGQGLARVGETAEARQILKEFRSLSKTRFISAYLPAIVQVGLGECDEAIDNLLLARRQMCSLLVQTQADARWAPLSTHARYSELLTALALPPPPGVFETVDWPQTVLDVVNPDKRDGR